MDTGFSSTHRWYGVFIELACCIPLLFNAPLHAAAVFDPSTQSPRTLGPFVFKNTNLYLGATKAYRPWFENKAWTGNVIEYDIDSGGTFSLSSANWSAQAVFATNELADSDYWNSGRKIITSTSGTNQVPFRWDNLSDAQKGTLDSSTAVNETQSDVLDFVRGNRVREGYGMRIRFGVLGDIVGSTPRYVANPIARYPFSGYGAFTNTNENRAARVYVGANDGMVHAFNADNGSEVFAYIPSMVIPDLVKLTQTPYTHTYFADGDLVVGDANFGSGGSDLWKTLLAGGLGAGGKGLFALDITSPDLSVEDQSSGTDKKILFEKTHADLGHVYGSPSVVKLPDGKWYVISGNGYGSTNGKAKLFLIELNSPTFTATSIDPDPLDPTLNNGLSTPVFLDKDGDSVVDVAYAGDLKGRLWKFEFGIDGSNILTVTATKLFTTGVNQPITVAPDVGAHPEGDYLIYFGTGSLLSNADIGNTQQQSVYAIWDKYAQVQNVCHDGTTGDLLCQTLTEDSSHSSSISVRFLATSNTPDWSIHKGWKVNLPIGGERLLGHPQLRGGRLQFVTTIPSSTGAVSWLIELDYQSGGDSGSILFDLNSDSVLDSGDNITVASVEKRAVAKKLDEGNLSQPAIARITNGTDSKIINGLLLTFDLPCTGGCSGGLRGGHIDVVMDTAKDGLGGADDAFHHEYDSDFGLTYVDYFNLQGTFLINHSVTNNGSIVSGGIDEANQKLVALVANADLSPGGVLTIGDRSWNVVEYQKLIQQKLAAWSNGSESDFVDGNGISLAFTLDQINSANGGSGTLRISFDDQAILSGGIIPNSNCVQNDPLGPAANAMVLAEPNGRWRAGALTLQLLDYNAIKLDIDNSVAANNRVYLLQNVSDLPKVVSLPTGIVSLQDSGVSYGGVIANPYVPTLPNAAFLYESTLFWDFSGTYCYGTDDWESQRRLALLSILKINDFLSTVSSTLLNTILADIADVLAQISSHNCSEFSPIGACTDAIYLGYLDNLADYFSQFEGVLLPIFQNYAVDISDLAVFIAYGGAAELQGDPNLGVATTDDLSSQQSAPGPTFTQGRQSWLEIEIGDLN